MNNANSGGTPKPLTHEEALDAICACSATVTLLSYEEAIEAYLSLRGWREPTERPRA